MSENIQVEYRGFKISYNEFSNKWRIEDDGEHGQRQKDTLAACKEWIDKIGKKEKKEKFKRFPALLCHYQQVKEVTVTSYAGLEYGRHHFWITDSEGKRSKEDGIRVYNEPVAIEIERLRVTKEKIEEKISELWEGLALVTPGVSGCDE
jgi:hypothetical protein